MHDIKLYAKSEHDIDSMIHLTWIYSEAPGILFILEKYGWIVIKRQKIINTNGVELPAGHISDIETSYKYLDIPQSHGSQKDKEESNF